MSLLQEGGEKEREQEMGSIITVENREYRDREREGEQNSF